MTALSKKCVVDTNVPLTANLARTPSCVPQELAHCVLACVEAIIRITSNGGLVLDQGDEIFDEYRKKLHMKGKPGVGDAFMKWVHDERWALPSDDLVVITKTGVSYREFPTDAALTKFDLSDRKFVAVANAHTQKPPILQGTDSKWWGWKEPLAKAGVWVEFLCSEYVEAKLRKKCPEGAGPRHPRRASTTSG